MTTKNLAWHFVGATLRDGSPIPADGVTLTFDGAPKLFERGHHWSRRPSGALKYAPGGVLCLVDVGGIIVEGDDKGVSTERTIVKRLNIEQLLREFARRQALSIAHLWDMPAVVREYLETGKEEIRAAASDGARAAASAAASDGARAAAWAAASDGAWAAAWAAARAQFDSMVRTAFGIGDET
jgi:hypothetical protein